MNKKLIRVIGLTVLAALLIVTVLMPVGVAGIGNDLQFYGRLTLQNQNVPAGTTITATIDGPFPWTGTVFVNLGGVTWYSIVIPATGRHVGDVVHFNVNINGVNYAGPDSIWQTPQDDEEPVVKHHINLTEPDFRIITNSLADGQVGLAYSATVEAEGGQTPYIWSATGLPGGLILSTDGTLSGVPQPDVGDYARFILPANIGDFDITFTAIESLGNSDSVTLTLSLFWRAGDANGDGNVNIADHQSRDDHPGAVPAHTGCGC